jgi:hypothetical protein
MGRSRNYVNLIKLMLDVGTLTLKASKNGITFEK